MKKQKGIRMGRYRIKARFFIFLLILVLVIAGLVWVGLKIADRYRGPSEEAPFEEMIGDIPVTRDLLEEGIPGRPGTLRTIRYVVIHETGNTAAGTNAANHNSYVHTEAAKQKLSWHYTVDDHEIYQHLPDNEVGFHAGDRLEEFGGNVCGIGIELCVNSDGDFETTLENAAKLAARLMDVYDLKMKDLTKHQDYSGKNCPQTLIESERWDEFCDMVKKELDARKEK
ncbi:MAG: N-acetylmuramoyl-L-alanine amidase [Firmicutes bacterium]|nr:N-acetylmuramoyl-L-alanine amidase [Bacillota bacterium]